jgi:hypothetical protein
MEFTRFTRIADTKTVAVIFQHAELAENYHDNFALTEEVDGVWREKNEIESISVKGDKVYINFATVEDLNNFLNTIFIDTFEVLEKKLKELFDEKLVKILLEDETIIDDFQYSTKDDESDEKIQDFVDYIAGYDDFDEDNQNFIKSSTFKKIKELYPEKFSYLPKKQGKKMEIITKADDSRVQYVLDCIQENSKMWNGSWKDWQDEYHAYETFLENELSYQQLSEIHGDSCGNFDYENLVKEEYLIDLGDDRYKDNEETFDFELLNLILTNNKKCEE